MHTLGVKPANGARHRCTTQNCAQAQLITTRDKNTRRPFKRSNRVFLVTIVPLFNRNAHRLGAHAFKQFLVQRTRFIKQGCSWNNQYTRVFTAAKLDETLKNYRILVFSFCASNRNDVSTGLVFIWCCRAH